ncbi:MAG: CHC2 zinc finger domain-containing protein [Nanoarchaeota archaeon]|nr:CHC2 zinc finger domain-containing protein [Nanoarchaeota archaeon]
MKQYDLLTRKESALIVNESLVIPSINSPSDLEKFLSELNVVQVGVHFLGDKVQRRPVSSNYRGLCPFHYEKTPSFYLKPKPNYFACYGCQEVGGPLALWSRLDERLLDDLLEHCKLHDEEIQGLFSGKLVSSFTPALPAQQQQYYTLFQDAIHKEYRGIGRFRSRF